MADQITVYGYKFFVESDGLSRYGSEKDAAIYNIEVALKNLGVSGVSSLWEADELDEGANDKLLIIAENALDDACSSWVSFPSSSGIYITVVACK